MKKEILKCWAVACEPDNPAHYFACVGLNELACAMSGAKLRCCFSLHEGQWHFRLDQAGPTLAEVVQPLRKPNGLLPAPLPEKEGAYTKNPPLIFPAHGGYVVDWWVAWASTNEDEDTGNSAEGIPKGVAGRWLSQAALYRGKKHGAFKFWSGQSTPRDFAGKVATQIASSLAEWLGGEDVFSFRMKRISMFRLDAESVSDARVAGFRRNKVDEDSKCSPLADLLTAVGLQRVMPPIENGMFRYAAWTKPLPPMLAAAACLGQLDVPRATFEAKPTPITKYSKACRYATQIQSLTIEE